MIEEKNYWKVNVAMLWLSQILVMAGYSAMIPFIPLFMKNELGVITKNDLALYVSMFNFCGTLGYTIFCPIWGWLSDKFGVKPMLLRGTFVTAFIFPIMGYVSTPGMLVFLRFLTACCAGTTAASYIMIARTCPDDKQGFGQGVLSTAIWGGAMLGNVVGGLIIHKYSYLHAFWLCGIMYFIAGFSILFTKDKGSRAEKTLPDRLPDTQEKHHRFRLIPDFTRAIWTMLFLFFVYGLIRNIEIPFISLRIEEMCEKGQAEYYTGITSAVVCVGAILSGVVSGYLADKLSPKFMIIPIFIISGIALISQGACDNLWQFGASRTMLYLFAGGAQPLMQKLLSSVTPKEKRGAAFGFSTCFNGIGMMVSATVGGWCMVAFSLNGVFYIGGLLFILTLPLFVVCISRLRLLSKNVSTN
ncbi:MAG: MFS transporter [Victivallales bacterium]|nr:MFS transporter [Victivallales bacterium]